MGFDSGDFFLEAVDFEAVSVSGAVDCEELGAPSSLRSRRAETVKVLATDGPAIVSPVAPNCVVASLYIGSLECKMLVMVQEDRISLWTLTKQADQISTWRPFGRRFKFFRLRLEVARALLLLLPSFSSFLTNPDNIATMSSPLRIGVIPEVSNKPHLLVVSFETN